MWPFDVNKKQREREFVQGISKKDPMTPDRGELSEYKHRLLFVCDDMKRAHKNYDLIRDCSAKVSRGFTADHFDYRIGRYTGKGLPFMAKRNEGHKIKGELHAIEAAHIPRLDKHYRNGVEFARSKVRILVTNQRHELIHIGGEAFLKDLPDGTIRTVPELGIRHYLSDNFICHVEAFMYVAIKKAWVHRPMEINAYPNVPLEVPKEPTVWLPDFYKYPINRNR